MKPLLILGLAAALALCPVRAEPGWRDYPGVENSSYVEPSGARAIQLSIRVAAPAQEVFEAFATEAGFTAWAVPFARIRLGTGGEIESSYDPHTTPGEPENIRNRIEAYIPGRLLVLRNVQAPAALPGREAFARTVTIVEFRAVSETETDVTVTNAGYGATPEDDAAYAHFEWGNAYTLAELQKHFAAR